MNKRKTPADTGKTNVINMADIDDVTGSIINERYEIIRKLGEGGMGEVYEGRHVGLERKVAIKLLRLDLAQEAELIERFNREAKMMAAIKHKGVVEIYDFGLSNNGVLYQVMEYLEGTDLLNFASPDEVLETDYAIDIVIQVLTALEKIHEKGIIHRDLKPDNIFICNPDTPDERVVILDFGISKIKRMKERRLTQDGIVVGTPYYMSPEQARAEELDLRTDLWSVGVILYEMITGSMPFPGEAPMEVLGGLLANPVIPPMELNHEIPEELNRIVLKAMEKNHEKRYSSAADFRYDLEIFRASQKSTTPTPTPVPADTNEVTAVRFQDDEDDPKVPRNWRGLIAIAVSLVLLCGSLLGVWIAGFFEDTPVAEASPVEIDSAKLTGKTHEPETPTKTGDAAPVAPDVALDPESLVKNVIPEPPLASPPIKQQRPVKSVRPRAVPRNPPDASVEPTTPPEPPPPVKITGPRTKAKVWLDDRPPREKRNGGAKVWLD